MRTFELRWETWQPDDDLFPEGMDWDETLVFHGTSSTRESVIDSDGLRPDAAGVPRDVVAAIVECYGRLGWSGLTTAGFPVLKSFTLRNDFRDGVCSPLYLSTMARQALFFATRNWAGGEKNMAVLRAAEDLRRLVDDADVREAAIRTPDQWARETTPLALTPALLEHARRVVEDIEPNIRTAREEQASYRYGVIYAIRPPVQIRATWEDCKGMGLRVLEPIPAEWIYVKLRVYPPPRAH